MPTLVDVISPHVSSRQSVHVTGAVQVPTQPDRNHSEGIREPVYRIFPMHIICVAADGSSMEEGGGL